MPVLTAKSTSAPGESLWHEEARRVKRGSGCVSVVPCPLLPGLGEWQAPGCSKKRRKREQPQVAYETGKLRRLIGQPRPLQESLPLRLLLAVQLECIAQCSRFVLWDVCRAAAEGSPDCVNKYLAIEVEATGRYPDVVEVLHSTVGHTECHHRLKLLRDYALARIRLHLGRGEV